MTERKKKAANTKKKAPVATRERSHHVAARAKNADAKSTAMEALKEPRQRQQYSFYSEEVVHELIMRIAAGEPVKRICQEERMPAAGTVFMWVVDGKHPEFTDLYHRAREAAGYAHADRMVSMTEGAEYGAHDPDYNAGAIKAAMTGLQWAAERMAPRRHSPRQEITGAEGGAVQTENAVQVYLPSNTREAHGRVIEQDDYGVSDD